MNPSPNLFLVGPMGAGKSTIGRRIAAHIALPFIDLDEELERRNGVSVALIFELEGEAGFRQREARLIEELSRREGIVLATGGGAVLDAANRRLLHARGFVLYLSTSVAQQLNRLARDCKRPLLQAPDRRERLEAMAQLRNPLYQEIADMTVHGSNIAVAQAARQIAAQLEARWQRRGVAA
ncbi:MAG: shikimate kinase AroK [Xanthomonadales bacterium]|nr:shikimate kinase AroK [Xanthomonadales bacterium]MCC6562375.1 shikimate kinase AroK [Xanthomonadales bacterium]